MIVEKQKMPIAFEYFWAILKAQWATLIFAVLHLLMSRGPLFWHDHAVEIALFALSVGGYGATQLYFHKRTTKALVYVWRTNHRNISHLQSWQQLKQDLVRKKFSEMRQAVQLACDFLAAMGRGSYGHLSEKQKLVLNNTAQELIKLNHSLESLFTEQVDLMNIEDVRLCSLTQSLHQSRHAVKDGKLKFPIVPSDQFMVALHPTIFAKGLDELIESCIQNASEQYVTARLSQMQGQQIHPDLDATAPYCHLELTYVLPYLRSEDWVSEVHYQVDLNLMYMKEICTWHGGRAWVTWPEKNQALIHLALPGLPSAELEKAS